LRTADLELQQTCLGLLVVTQCIQLSDIHCYNVYSLPNFYD